MTRNIGGSSRKGRGRVVFHVVGKGRSMFVLVGGLALLVGLIGAGSRLGWSLPVEHITDAFGRLPFVSFTARDDEGTEEVGVPVLSGAVSVGETMTVREDASRSDGIVVSVEPQSTEQAKRVHPYDLLRLERERNRSRAAEAWQTAAKDGSRGRDERDAAALHLERMWTESQRETEIEHLLESEGYDVVATVGEGRVHVVVDAVLDEASAARLGELAAKVAGVSREAVTIVDSFSQGR